MNGKSLHRLGWMFALLCAIVLRAGAEPYKPIPMPPLLMEERRQLYFMSYQKRQELLRSLSPEKKKIYADASRRFDPDLPYEDFNLKKDDFDELLALDDEITGKYLVRQFEIHQYEAIAGHLVQWHSPLAVAAFARASMSEVPYPDTGEQPMSFTSAGPMLGLVGNIKEFPPQVRDWARSIEQDRAAFFREKSHEAEAVPLDKYDPNWRKGYRFDDREREVVQKWWRANEKAVTEGRLPETVPGEAFVAPSRFMEGVTEVWRPKVKTADSLASARNSVSKQTVTSPNDKADTENPAQNARNNFGIYAALASLLAVIVIYFRKRLFRGTRDR